MNKPVPKDPKPASERNPPIAKVWAAVTPVGSDKRIDKVLQRKIRLQVLDCRSGKPVTHQEVEEVKVDGVEIVRFLNKEGWDYVANYIVPAGSKGPLKWDGFKGKDTKRLQEVLTAIGYECGKPEKHWTKEAAKAMTAYQEAWYEKNPPKPAKPGKNDGEKVWIPRIVAQYNEKFFRAVQVDLTALGYPCQCDDGKWDDASQKAFAAWQSAEVNADLKPLATFNSLKNTSRLIELAKKLKDPPKHFFTDSEGILHVPIPVTKIKSGFKLRISFHEFCVVLEEEGFRHGVPQQPTTFGIEYAAKLENGQDRAQNPTTGQWGWRLRPPGYTQETAQLPEFRSFLEIEVPAAPTLKWRDLSAAERRKAGFSPHFAQHEWADPMGQRPEFVAFALVWCQPVYDDIEDPTGIYTADWPVDHSFNQHAYLDPDHVVSWPRVRGRHMHIVTRVRKNGTPYQGKGYGKTRGMATAQLPFPRGFKHGGIDIYGRQGDNVFAMRGGTAKLRHKKKLGQYVEIETRIDQKKFKLQYLHLSAYVVADSANVKAGERIGRVGHTGDFSSLYNDNINPAYAPPSELPTHMHLNKIGAFNYVQDSDFHIAFAAFDPDNSICLATNDFPLLFPCACDVSNKDESPEDCKFDDEDFTKTCWAVAELKCPHMLAPGSIGFRLQAQLRWLWQHHASKGYLDPGLVNGKATSQETRNAIKKFREINKLSAGDHMDQDAWNILNDLAVVREPEPLPV